MDHGDEKAMNEKRGIDVSLSVLLTNSKEQSPKIPILDRKEFVAIRLWRNLDWEFLIIERIERTQPWW